MTRYFNTNNTYRIEGDEVYRWSFRHNCWLLRTGFKPSDFTDGTLLAVEVDEKKAKENILLTAEIYKQMVEEGV